MIQLCHHLTLNQLPIIQLQLQRKLNRMPYVAIKLFIGGGGVVAVVKQGCRKYKCFRWLLKESWNCSCRRRKALFQTQTAGLWNVWSCIAVTSTLHDSWMLINSLRYCSWLVCNVLNVIVAILNITHCERGSQFSLANASYMVVFAQTEYHACKHVLHMLQFNQIWGQYIVVKCIAVVQSGWNDAAGFCSCSILRKRLMNTT